MTSSDCSEHYSDSLFDWKGKILENRYIIIKKIDRGAYASVWISFDTINEKYYAIKINNRDKYDYKTAKKELCAYNIIKNFRNDQLMNINSTFDVQTDKGIHVCFVMELMACSLYNIIKCEK